MAATRIDVKGCFVFLLVCGLVFSSEAAVWLSGSKSMDTLGNSGVYGTKGVPSSSNIPGARYLSASWVDGDGNLWLFGGFFTMFRTGKLYNDLWKYDVLSGQWTWVSGANTPANSGVYGTKGVASVAYCPCARDGSVTWVDSSGDFWLFGGNNRNDLWRFNPATGAWAWMSGSIDFGQPGVYGTKGVPDVSNVPGGRGEAISWTGPDGSLWLFGGVLRSSELFGTNYYMSDLWRFDPSTGLWTWVSGLSVTNQPGTYGIKGIAGAANVPGARSGSVSWTDDEGNFWLFGGYGYDSTGAMGYLNDLWKYDISMGLWVWMSGSNLRNQSGFYGVHGQSNPLNMPAARSGSISWVDGRGEFWLLGGDHDPYPYWANDLWRYSPSSGLWTWMRGPNLANQTGIYGTKGVANSANMPGARTRSTAWASGNHLYLFGGYGCDATGVGGFLNDLWKFTCDGDPGDLNGDCTVDFDDLDRMAQDWLADYTFIDFKAVSKSWFMERYPD
ncbi:MAG TPA: kelch repeat-containing protein [Anaerohalosphaeraceae bacterium]|nr:kelch repeat-containing protein [Anaerohalosphaeraceae bacterium]